MVDKSYMESRPPPPSAARVYIDQQMIPAVIDMAGCMEAGVERVATLVRSRPAVTLGTALMLGASLAYLLLGRRPRRRFF